MSASARSRPRPFLAVLRLLALCLSVAAILAGTLTLVGSQVGGQADGPTLTPDGGAVAAAAESTHWREFLEREPYTGEFADPSVVRVGKRYYAVATTTANLNLPVMSSTDLSTWTPRPARADHPRYSDWKRYNEAMVVKPAWALKVGQRERVSLMSQWAPALARIGTRYVVAFSAATSNRAGRDSCIGLATSSSPFGDYQPVGTRPLVCFKQSPLGAIDPELYTDPTTKKNYLLWKQEGIAGVQPPMIKARQLDAAGTTWAAGSKPTTLLRLSPGTWEGGVVENPSMLRYRGRLYLTYSGNQWKGAQYATGYATCSGPLGPCTKAPKPILVSDATYKGPGGGDLFTTPDGQLKMAYHAWKVPFVGPSSRSARRMYVATLGVRTTGALYVARKR